VSKRGRILRKYAARDKVYSLKRENKLDNIGILEKGNRLKSTRQVGGGSILTL